MRSITIVLYMYEDGKALTAMRASSLAQGHGSQQVERVEPFYVAGDKEPTTML